jgi:hypothetical protein
LSFQNEKRKKARFEKSATVSGGEMKKLALLTLVLLAVTAVAQNSVSLPAGTTLKVKLLQTLTTSSKSGDNFSGRVTEAVMIDGKPVVPIGATVQGRVINANEPRRISGKPTITIFPDTLVMPNGDFFTLNATLENTDLFNGTSVNSEGQFKGKGYDNKDLIEMGAGTGGGMLVGGLIGGGKGVLIGGVVGASVTVTHWLIKKNSATLPSGTELTMELSRPMALTALPGGAGN